MKEDLLADDPVELSRTANRGIRQAGILFVLLGAGGLTAFWIPGGLAYHRPTVLIADLIVLAAGGLLCSPLAQRLTGYRSLVISALGLGLLAVCDADGLLTPAALGVYFVIVFMWIGLWHPPGTGIRFIPIAVAAYLLPYTADAPDAAGNKASVVLVVGASVIVAEVLARQARTVRRAQIEQADALQALSRASRTDDLTGLGNRRLGNQLLERLADGDAIVILDVDHFKAVNDLYGHGGGDRLLQDLGGFLQGASRTADTVARMGGEEFLLVVKNTLAEEALNHASHLVDAWRRTRPLATISAGVAVHVNGQSPSATYASADAALYQAKKAGRDHAQLGLYES